MRVDGIKIHDVVGIGFGPSNLSLATALDEIGSGSDGGHAIDAVFFEKQPALGWHQGMLLPGSKMQVSFLKDLATFRNPSSPYSFVAYLHSEGRLAAFVNRKDFFPSRREFHDYLEWVEAQFTKYVTYNSEVVSVSPRRDDDGAVDCLQLEVRRTDSTGDTRLVHTRNIVISTGLVAQMPRGVERGDAVWHSSEFITRFQELDTSGLRSVAVVGAGQSAAEILRFLYDNVPDAELYGIMSPLGYSVADNTPLANQVFDPSAVDDYYFSSERSKEAVWRYHRNTNYSVVDDELIRDLYERAYQDELRSRTRLRFLSLSRAQSAETVGGRTRVAVESLRSGAVDSLDVDLLVCATGYEPMDPTLVLNGLAESCQRDNQGRLRVERDYRVVTTPDIRCGIYLQGGTEHTHGLSSSLLSNIAVRSGEIADSIARSCVRSATGFDQAEVSGRGGLTDVEAV